MKPYVIVHMAPSLDDPHVALEPVTRLVAEPRPVEMGAT